MLGNGIQMLLFFLLGFGLAAVAALLLFVWHSQQQQHNYSEVSSGLNLLSASFYDFPQAMCVSSLKDGTILEVNRGFERDSGWMRSEIIGKSTLETLWGDEKDRALYKQRLQNERKLLTFGVNFYDKQKRKHHVLLTSHVFVARNSEEQLIMTAFSDWTVQKRTEDTTSRENARFREFFHNMRDAAVVCDRNGYFIEFNRAFATSLGYTPEELMRLRPREVTPKEQHERDIYLENKLLASDEPFTVYEKEHIKKDGTRFPVELQLYSFRDPEGNPDGFWGIVRDLSEKTEQQQKLDFLASHDPMTGLPNRVLFMDRFDHALIRVKRDETQKLALICIDLDHFKQINDTLGFQMGDALLCVVAGQLQKLLRGGDTLARVGSDEFIILLEDLVETSTISIVVERLHELFQRPMLLKGQEIYQTASIGISLYPDHGDEVDTLLKCADIAMLKAKELGRNTWQFYEQKMGENIPKHLQLSNSLRNALQNHELLLCYQPLLELSSGKLVGVEALVRWMHPEYGILLPDDFIPLAEEIGFISNIDNWVLQEACQQMRHWREKGFNVPRISVNLSVQQLERSGFVDYVRQQLEENHLEPELLELEITESTLMQRFGRALQHLRELQALGVFLSVDDFGTGYSSLGNLKRMPIHQLKIDYSFIQDIGRDKNDEAIASAIIAMAKSLDLEVVAEGIERHEQKNFLLSEGCHIAQGFLYEQAIPADKLQTQWGEEKKEEARPDEAEIQVGEST